DVERVEHPAGSREPAADEPGPEDDPLGSYTAYAGEVRVVRHGAHGLADLGALQEQVDEEDQDDGCREDEELVGAHPEPRKELDYRPGPALVVEREVGSEDHVDDAPDAEREAEGRHGHHDRGCATLPQPPERDTVQPVRYEACQRHDDEQRYDELVTEPQAQDRGARRYERHDHEAEVCAGRHVITVS